jgi:hypothetical protein
MKKKTTKNQKERTFKNKNEQNKNEIQYKIKN